MIRGLLFDLDGTLVKTERLKAISYARAATELTDGKLKESDVVEAFKDVVGLARREVATGLMRRFGFEPQARTKMSDFGVNTPWQAYVQYRLRIYEEMLDDPETIKGNQWPHAMGLLRAARKDGCKTGLATMSYCPQVTRVLNVLGLDGEFDFVATRDDVEKAKPDPEIYLLVAKELSLSAPECLVIEDSPAGVQAGLGAGMQMIAVSTPFTRARLHECGLLPENRIVDEHEKLPAIVEAVVGSQRSVFRCLPMS